MLASRSNLPVATGGEGAKRDLHGPYVHLIPGGRRRSSRAHPDASCQPPEKEKSRPCRRRRGRRAPGVGTLPDGVLSAIFSRVPSGAAGVARCAAACRRWARVVATRAAAIARALPQPRPAGFLPHLALGVIHGAQIRGTRTRRKPVVSIASSGGSPSLRLDGGGGLFDSARRPVASRNGRVVLELRREHRADGLTLCVCNPMTGPPDDAAVLPALAGDDCPGYFACAMLTADDLDATVTGVPPTFFRVLLVYNRRSFTALRCYSSDAGSWGPERRKPGAKMSARTLQQLGPAAVWSAAWHTGPPRTARRSACGWTTAAAPRCWTCAGCLTGCQTSLARHAPRGVRRAAGRRRRHHAAGRVCWVPYRMPDFLPDFRVHHWRRRWFGDKSGTLVFTIGEGGNTSGAFALNLATSSVEKLGDGVHCNSWTNLCGYEMDRATLLALVAARFF
ncbi:unnamed protein product [Urochloa decumbens]|uniref:F-box domain-containing protein n=1 Tax=Urochloa decumbens TaxID=240449 RepID=A0ABC9BGT7_9POAL